MTLISSTKDPQRRSLTLVSEFDVPARRVWLLWSEPDRFARWWGPPGYPLTVDHHELAAGGAVRFHVDFPDGTSVNARLELGEVEPLRRLTSVFHSDGGIEPVSIDVEIDALDADRTRMTVVASFHDDAAMAHAVDIGYDQGIATSLGRADEALETAA